MHRLISGVIALGLTLAVPPVGHAQRSGAAVRVLETYRGGGVLLERAMYSPALRQEVTYQAFLPPDYEGSRQRYPTLYLLHGVDSNPEQWPLFGVSETADELVSAGEIRPMVIVFPFGGNSYYVNEPDGGLRWADHVTEEVTQDVDSSYRTIREPSSRAIGGLSMGGDAALRFGLTRPSIFAVVGAHSPTTRLKYRDAPGGIFDDKSSFNRANPLWLIENRGVPAGLKIWIDVGDEDGWRRSAEALSDALDAEDHPHDFHYYQGEHEDAYWAAHVPDYLLWYSSALSDR